MRIGSIERQLSRVCGKLSKILNKNKRNIVYFQIIQRLSATAPGCGGKAPDLKKAERDLIMSELLVGTPGPSCQPL